MAQLKNTTVNDTGFIQISSGTTAQRPNSPQAGMIRWNTDINNLEFYNGVEWIDPTEPLLLYDFVDATFTPGSNTGRTGPSLSQAIAGMSGTGIDNWKNNTNYFSVSNGIQQWTVPVDGFYKITAAGAQGGDENDNNDQGGAGATVEGEFTLLRGEVIKILVGQRGEEAIGGGGGGNGAGGGGASFVTTFNNDILLIAGGGGGADGSASGDGRPGVITEDGTSVPSGGAGGTNGSGGSAGTGADGGGGGGGYSGNGGSDTGQGGSSYLNGGLGGNSQFAGGFGGGGGGTTASSAGGGGGYSGGGAGQDGASVTGGGGGGGSINFGFSPNNQEGANTGPGSVTIELLN